MAEQTFKQIFQGYWREISKNGIPNKSGIYCVYECTFNEILNNITIHRLIYIGESANVRERITTHEKHKEWVKYIRKSTQICYSFTPIELSRQRVEAAFIFQHKPPVNIEFTETFPFEKTIVQTGAENELLDEYFFVNPT